MNEAGISVIIIEDEQPARELLIDYIIKRKELRIDDIAKNGEEALQKLSKNRYDIIFLDIALPLMSGIEVLESIDYSPYVIFTSAYDHYAIRAFELGAVDYLLKPYTFERFNQAINKALVNLKDKVNLQRSLLSFGLSFKENNRHYIVAFDDLIFLSSNARHTIIHTADRDFETSQMLKELIAKLPDDTFVRIHKQYCVNLKYVSGLEYLIGGQYELTLKDPDITRLPVGQKFSPILKGKLKI